MNLAELKNIEISGGYLPIVNGVKYVFRILDDDAQKVARSFTDKKTGVTTTSEKYLLKIRLSAKEIVDTNYFDYYKKENLKKAEALEKLVVDKEYTLELAKTHAQSLGVFLEEQFIDIDKHMITMIREKKEIDGEEKFVCMFNKLE